MGNYIFLELKTNKKIKVNKSEYIFINYLLKNKNYILMQIN